MNHETAADKLAAAVTARTTEELFSDLEELDKHREPNGMLPTPEERMVAALIATVIERRHDLTDALDAIWADGYDGLYTLALRQAYDATK